MEYLFIQPSSQLASCWACRMLSVIIFLIATTNALLTAQDESITDDTFSHYIPQSRRHKLGIWDDITPASIQREFDQFVSEAGGIVNPSQNFPFESSLAQSENRQITHQINPHNSKAPRFFRPRPQFNHNRPFHRPPFRPLSNNRPQRIPHHQSNIKKHTPSHNTALLHTPIIIHNNKKQQQTSSYAVVPGESIQSSNSHHNFDHIPNRPDNPNKIGESIGGCNDDTGRHGRGDVWFVSRCRRRTCIHFRGRHFMETDSCDTEFYNTTYRCIIQADTTANYPECCPKYVCNPDNLGNRV